MMNFMMRLLDSVRVSTRIE